MFPLFSSLFFSLSPIFPLRRNTHVGITPYWQGSSGYVPFSHLFWVPFVLVLIMLDSGRSHPGLLVYMSRWEHRRNRLSLALDHLKRLSF